MDAQNYKNLQQSNMNEQIETDVNALSTTQSQYSEKGMRSIAYRCSEYMNSVIEVINTAPSAMYDSIVDAGGNVAKKIRTYADALQGKADSSNVVMESAHFKFVEGIRNTNPKIYQDLVNFAKKYPTLAYDDQPNALINFYAQVQHK